MSTIALPVEPRVLIVLIVWSLTNTQIRGPATPVPVKCISNPKEKVWLECFPPLIFIAGN